MRVQQHNDIEAHRTDRDVPDAPLLLEVLEVVIHASGQRRPSGKLLVDFGHHGTFQRRDARLPHRHRRAVHTQDVRAGRLAAGLVKRLVRQQLLHFSCSRIVSVPLSMTCSRQ